MTMPASCFISAWASMSSPMSELVRSPPASTMMTSPASARSSALWNIKLSPGRVLTVSAGPASPPPACIGRRLAPPAVMRAMLSLTLATGRLLKRSVSSGLTFRLRRKILNPMLKCSFLPTLENLDCRSLAAWDQPVQHLGLVSFAPASVWLVTSNEAGKPHQTAGSGRPRSGGLPVGSQMHRDEGDYLGLSLMAEPTRGSPGC